MAFLPAGHGRMLRRIQGARARGPGCRAIAGCPLSKRNPAPATGVRDPIRDAPSGVAATAWRTFAMVLLGVVAALALSGLVL
ncbi:MAG TPA: hypothetical protein VJ927_03725 [Actinomycetota bacterium]|nr:hypothetical protein [Actinomycetota bacterium]